MWGGVCEGTHEIGTLLTLQNMNSKQVITSKIMFGLMEAAESVS